MFAWPYPGEDDAKVAVHVTSTSAILDSPLPPKVATATSSAL